MYSGLCHNRLVGIGTDIVYLPRIAKILEKYTLDCDLHTSRFYRLAKKFMHPAEIDELDALLKPKTFLSPTRVSTFIGGVWAAKESTYKALSCYVPSEMIPPAQSIYTRLIYKSKRPNGLPVIEFDETFKTHCLESSNFYEKYIEKPKIKPFISVSHDNEYLVSFVNLIAESEIKE